MHVKPGEIKDMHMETPESEDDTKLLKRPENRGVCVSERERERERERETVME